MTMSKEPDDKIDQEVDDLVEKLSEEDQELLDQALANLMGFIEQETTLGFWETEEEVDD
jgi:predicted transcriptional regulator